jgi:hypothetical protein
MLELTGSSSPDILRIYRTAFRYDLNIGEVDNASNLIAYVDLKRFLLYNHFMDKLRCFPLVVVKRVMKVPWKLYGKRQRMLPFLKLRNHTPISRHMDVCVDKRIHVREMR